MMIIARALVIATVNKRIGHRIPRSHTFSSHGRRWVALFLFPRTRGISGRILDWQDLWILPWIGV